MQLFPPSMEMEFTCRNKIMKNSFPFVSLTYGNEMWELWERLRGTSSLTSREMNPPPHSL